jgi:hypothetical protein
MVFAVIGLLIVFVGLGLASIAAWKHTADRGRKLDRLAQANGFTFSHDDLAGLTTLPFDLFQEGDGRSAHNVMTGHDPDGSPARVFDFTYFIETEDRVGELLRSEDALYVEPKRSRRYYRYSCCVTEMPVAWPHLIVEPERWGRRLLNKLGLPDIDVESEAFNRNYAVTCEDRRFAELLFDPRLVDLILGTDKKFRFEIRGSRLMAATERVPANLALPMVRLNTEFRRRVPALVLDEYPEIAPEGRIGGWVGPGSPGGDEQSSRGIDLGTTP